MNSFNKQGFLTSFVLRKGYVQTAEIIGKYHYFFWCEKNKCYFWQINDDNAPISHQKINRKDMIEKIKTLEYIGYKINYFKS